MFTRRWRVACRARRRRRWLAPDVECIVRRLARTAGQLATALTPRVTGGTIMNEHTIRCLSQRHKNPADDCEDDAGKAEQHKPVWLAGHRPAIALDPRSAGGALHCIVEDVRSTMRTFDNRIVVVIDVGVIIVACGPALPPIVVDRLDHERSL